MARIYVSSTFKDLEECREKVRLSLRQMGHEDIAMEYYVAGDERPLDKCLKDIVSCKLYIGIFAWRYGFVPDGYDKSITELEYRKAKESGKKCLIFLLHEEAFWPRNFVDKGEDQEKIEALRKELSAEKIVSFFKSAEELAVLVNVAVYNCEKESENETPKGNPGQPNNYSLSLRDQISLNSSAKIQMNQEDDFLLLPDESPFHPYGTIPLDHQSYIARDSDLMLNELLKRNLFICLHGDFCSGKSSLLIRVPEMLPKAWNVYQPQIALYSSRRKGSLERNFFIELQRINKDIRDWVFISDLLKRTKLALLIDEIGKYSSQDVREFIESLYALVDHASPDNIRIILTIPRSLDSYIRNIGLDNPKYIDRWKIVEMTDFTKKELIKMLDIFPHPVADSLRRNLTLIQNYTLMKPNEVQKFCENLWNNLRGSKIPMMEIDQKIQCYLENLEKV